LNKIINEFKFDCQKTAHCCENMEIFLNPFDILKISKKLDNTTTQIIDKYIIFLENTENGLYRPIIKSARRGLCIFNIDKLCSIHNSRPLSCRLFPLARINKEYILQDVDFCKGLKENIANRLLDYIKEDSGIDYLSMADLFHEKYEKLKNLNTGLLNDKYYNNLLNVLLYDFDYFYNGELNYLNCKDKAKLSFYLVENLIEIYDSSKVYDKEVIIEKLFLEGDKFLDKNFS